MDRFACRTLILRSMIVATLAVTAVTGWAVWPIWQEYRYVQSLIRALHDEDASHRMGAARQLGTMGVRASDAIPALIETLKQDDDADVRGEAAEAIANVAERRQAVAVLVKPLEDRNDWVRGAVVRLLGEIATPEECMPAILASLANASGFDNHQISAAKVLSSYGQASVPDLVAALTSPSPVVREVAAAALEQIGQPAELATDELRRLLDDEEPAVRLQAAQSLWAIRADASALPRLMEFLNDPEPSVRAAAASMLRDSHMAGPVAARLIAALRHDDIDVCGQAMKSLVYGHVQAPELVPALGRLLAEPNVEIRRSAVELAGQVEVEPAAVLPLIVKALDDGDPGIRDAKDKDQQLIAVRLLCSFSSRSDLTKPIAVKLLRDRDVNIRRWAAGFLFEFGLSAQEAEPLLFNLMRDRDAEVRIAAVEQLYYWDEDQAVRVVPKLIDALKDTDPQVRETAARTLALVGERARPSIPALTALLEDRRESVRVAARCALDEIDPKPLALLGELVERLAKAADDDDAIYAIKELGPQAKPAVPHLIELLKDANARRVELIISALLSISSDDISVLLTGMKSETDFFVRSNAALALEMLRSDEPDPSTDP